MRQRYFFVPKRTRGHGVVREDRVAGPLKYKIRRYRDATGSSLTVIDRLGRSVASLRVDDTRRDGPVAIVCDGMTYGMARMRSDDRRFGVSWSGGRLAVERDGRGVHRITTAGRLVGAVGPATGRLRRRVEFVVIGSEHRALVTCLAVALHPQ